MLFFLVIWLFLMKSCVKGTFLVVPDSTISDNITQSLTNVTFDFKRLQSAAELDTCNLSDNLSGGRGDLA